MNKQIPEEVKAGMELLDQEVPGWREKIDLDSLDLSDCYECILGQVFGHFNEGRRMIAEVDNDPGKYGFDCHPTGYEFLTQIWKEALSQTSGPVAAD